MNIRSKNIQLQYQGYLDTPLLWNDDALLGLKQLELDKQATSHFYESIADQLLLGKRVERFVNAELEQIENIEILLENAQVKNKKTTIGEIDCILKQDGIPIHLEIIYKFYLYDSSVGDTEIDRWIGPNRKDSLVKKLHKLKSKQLPLLYNTYARTVLNKVNIDPAHTLQRVLFKAQLFTPFQENVAFNLLNKECLSGFYIHFPEIQQLSNCKFYIPIKVDWLTEVQSNTDWLSYLEFEKIISALIAEKRAPLCWIKFPNGIMQKFFVVWWGGLMMH
ncbi:DUF1853 family protein [Lutimonas sp.]|uniref:DUF1853 family protein n=1 Tax=Lutimonas sp. TaxID=1872403 RepID=UPI003C7902FF